MKKVFTVIFLLINLFALAQENPLEEAIRNATGYGEMEYYNLEVKALPNNPNQSIACVTRSEKGLGDEEFLDVDLVLILIDNNSKKIIAQHIEKEKYTSDAIKLDGVSLDMANYTVADGVRAFGVRDSYSGSSHPNPYGSENLSLYTLKNNRFQLILDKFETHKYTGETDMKCYFDGEETNSVLIMQKTKTNEYYDIKVRSVTTILKSRNPKKEDDDCIDTETKLKSKFKTLQFVKGKYHWKKK